MNDPFENFGPIMARVGAVVSPMEFQRRVNIYFHAAESEVYDKIHAEMRDSLQPQFEWLSATSMAAIPETKVQLRMLDIGCGTGLSAEFLLNTALGRSIGHCVLLDTSPEMLRRAERRSQSWDKPVTLRHGVVDDLATTGERYDIVLISSVLHHIPHLDEFLTVVSGLQNAGGVLLHLQDPNGDYINDEELAARRQAAEEAERQPRITLSLARLTKAVANRIWGSDIAYMEAVNARLLADDIIKRPMADEEIWAVTDIHDFLKEGISLAKLKQLLSGYQLLGARSYAFFGRMASKLPSALRRQEVSLFHQGAMNGTKLTAAWIVGPSVPITSDLKPEGSARL